MENILNPISRLPLQKASTPWVNITASKMLNPYRYFFQVRPDNFTADEDAIETITIDSENESDANIDVRNSNMSDAEDQASSSEAGSHDGDVQTVETSDAEEESDPEDETDNSDDQMLTPEQCSQFASQPPSTVIGQKILSDANSEKLSRKATELKTKSRKKLPDLDKMSLTRRPKTKKNLPKEIQPEERGLEADEKEKTGSLELIDLPKAHTCNGKSYEDFSPIMDGYGFLLDHLNPDDPASEVDKVVKYILDKNIMVRHISILLSHFYCSRGPLFYKCTKDLANLKLGRYSPGKFGEDASLLNQWKELVCSVPIYDPKKFLLEVSNVPFKCKLVLKQLKGAKRNVVGCFLGQNLSAVRHAADIFFHAEKLLKPPLVSGKFSKEEDATILQGVEKNGACTETWKHLANLLNRAVVSSIARRYNRLTEEKNLYLGKWSLTEDAILLECLFGGKRNANLIDIKSFQYMDVKPFVAILNRSQSNIWERWITIIQPILLSYHFGTLHKLWRLDFYKYIIKNKITCSQDINYAEAIEVFPEQTADSLHASLIRFAKNWYQGEPLYRVIESCLPTYKDRQESEKVRNFREEIVKIYDHVKNQTYP